MAKKNLESLSIFQGHLKTSKDLDLFMDKFYFFGSTADKARSKHTCRNIWHTLTGSSDCKNIYYTTMPFCIRAVQVSPSSEKLGDVKCNALILSTDYNVEGMPDGEKDASLFLISAVLCMQIRKDATDFEMTKTDVWLPPRDLYELENTKIFPVTSGYVELFLHSIKYVSDCKYEDDKSKNKERPSIFEYMLSKSPDSVKKAWAGFKETFLVDLEYTSAI